MYIQYTLYYISLISFGGNFNGNPSDYLFVYKNITDKFNSNREMILISGYIRIMFKETNAFHKICITTQQYYGIICLSMRVDSIGPRVGHNGCPIRHNGAKRLFIIGGGNKAVTNESFIITFNERKKLNLFERAKTMKEGWMFQKSMMIYVIIHA